VPSGSYCTPHQALGHTADPHRYRIEHDADRGDPEVHFNGPDAVHLLATKEARDQVVQAAHRDQTHPAQCARVHMADRPVGVVRQRVDRLDRHHRTFEGRHAVERERDDQKTQDRVIAQFVPGA
jgi:hypothetical protein